MRTWPEIQCGKVAFTQPVAAEKAKRARRRFSDVVTEYRCPVCRRWHIGHGS